MSTDESQAHSMTIGPVFPPTDLEIVDLSVTLAENLPCHWATHQPFQHKTWTWFADDGDQPAPVHNRGGPYTTRWMTIDEHTGTHFDAPSHFIPPPGSGLPEAGPAGEVTAEKVSLDRLMGPAAVIDVPLPEDSAGTPGVSPLIEPGLVAAWERDHGPLSSRDVVLFRTGWDRHFLRGHDGDRYVHDVVVTQRRPGWPAPAVATVEMLLDRGVRSVGVDTPSIGPAHDGAPVHRRGLRAGMTFVECLTGLGRLPVRGAWFCFLPLKVEGGTGAPGRAIAVLPGPRTTETP